MHCTSFHEFVLAAGSERKKNDGSHQPVRTLSVSAVDRPSEDQSTSFFFVLAYMCGVVVCALVYLSGNFFFCHTTLSVSERIVLHGNGVKIWMGIRCD